MKWRTGGEPDLIGTDKERVSIFTATVRRRAHRAAGDLCYDQAGLDSRKENKPLGSAMAMASNMGIELLTEDHYFYCRKRVNMIAKRPVGSARLPMSGSWEGAVRGFSIWTCICVS